jgi:methyl-accepting chemotaxis protein-1 (serine sensor receptor)
MLNNITIRGGLTLVISVFVAFLLTVIAVGYGALKLANGSLDDTQRSAVELSHLKASSEKLLQVQLALGTYQTLFSVGKQTDDLLPAAHKVLLESNKDFRNYMAGPFASDGERRLAQSVEQARAALVDKAIEPEFKALTDFDFNTFRNIQGDTANSFYATYSKAIDALENAQIDTQHQQAATGAQRFQLATLLFVAVGVIALVIGVAARIALSAALIKPVNATVKHFERIAAGDLTVAIKVRSRNEMGQLLGALTKMRDGLVETVAKVRGSTSAITQGANEIAAGNADLSARTEQQAAALQQTAASMEQLSATVKQNAGQRQAGQSARPWRARHGHARRHGGVARHQNDGRDQRVVAQSDGDHRHDRGDRVSDQHSRVERGGGSCARRRAGTRLRGGGLGGAQPCAALGGGGQGDQGTDRRIGGEGGGGRLARV